MHFVGEPRPTIYVCLFAGKLPQKPLAGIPARDVRI